MKHWKRLAFWVLALASPGLVYSHAGLTCLLGTITDPSCLRM